MPKFEHCRSVTNVEAACEDFMSCLPDGHIGYEIRGENGGVLALSGVADSSTTALSHPIREPMSWNVMPNPGRSEWQWSTEREWSGSLEVLDMLGKRIDVLPVNHQRQGLVDAQEWPAGSYILRPWVAHMDGDEKGAPVGTPLTWIKLPD